MEERRSSRGREECMFLMTSVGQLLLSISNEEKGRVFLYCIDDEKRDGEDFT